MQEGAVAEQVRCLERQHQLMKSSLRMMTTAGSVVPGDFLGDAYLKAGGGYEGLQAIAETALKTVEEMES